MRERAPQREPRPPRMLSTRGWVLMGAVLGTSVGVVGNWLSEPLAQVEAPPGHIAVGTAGGMIVGYFFGRRHQ